MAQMKTEQDWDSINGDIWLSDDWAYPEESLKQEENIKTDVLAIKQENNLSATSDQSNMTGNNTKNCLEKQMSKQFAFEKNRKTQRSEKSSTQNKIGLKNSARTDSKKSRRELLKEAIEKATLSDTIAKSANIIAQNVA